MPTDMTRYGPDWRDFSALIRFNRAHYRCECTGQCGLHQPNPTTRRCVERHHQPARWAKGLIRLTVAHTCGCDPPCQNPAHVLAMCQRCHLRIDRIIHALHRQATQAKKLAIATTSKTNEARGPLDTTL